MGSSEPRCPTASAASTTTRPGAAYGPAFQQARPAAQCVQIPENLSIRELRAHLKPYADRGGAQARPSVLVQRGRQRGWSGS